MSIKNKSNADELDNALKDKLVSIGKGAAGVIPFAGGFLAEIIGASIPGQRADRISAYLRLLAKRVDGLEDDLKEQILSSPEKIDLIEEGGHQSVRATSHERIEHIVEAVANGLKAEDTSIIRRKRLLSVLGEIDDDEVALLIAYGQSYGQSNPSAFDKIIRPATPHMQSSTSEVDEYQLYDAGKQRLTKLGLLKKYYPFLKQGELPKFNIHQGDFEHSVQISYLGRMLLAEIGLETPFDQKNRTVRSSD